MPNGKPGDHPITDIITHRMHLYGGGVDEEIFKIATEFGDRGIERLYALAHSAVFANATEALNEQQKILQHRLADIWNELILERRRRDHEKAQ